MSDDTTSYTMQGASQGAQAGSAFGPWGALIGAVIGGVLGDQAGAKAQQAKDYMKKADMFRRQQQTMQLAIQRRDIIRQMRLSQAQAIAAGASEQGVTSSSVRGALASSTAQGGGAVQYFDTQIALDNVYQKYAKKAGKKMQQAEGIMSILGSAGSLTRSAADLYGMSKSDTAPKVDTAPYTSFNNSAAVNNMQNNSAFTSYGSSLDLK